MFIKHEAGSFFNNSFLVFCVSILKNFTKKKSSHKNRYDHLKINPQKCLWTKIGPRLMVSNSSR